MQAKQSSKCTQNYAYKYLQEYILHTQGCPLDRGKRTSTAHLLFAGEHTAENEEVSSSGVGLKNARKQEGNF